MSEKNTKNILFCSFWGKRQHAVKKLIKSFNEKNKAKTSRDLKKKDTKPAKTKKISKK